MSKVIRQYTTEEAALLETFDKANAHYNYLLKIGEIRKALNWACTDMKNAPWFRESGWARSHSHCDSTGNPLCLSGGEALLQELRLVFTGRNVITKSEKIDSQNDERMEAWERLNELERLRDLLVQDKDLLVQDKDLLVQEMRDSQDSLRAVIKAAEELQKASKALHSR